MVFDKILIDFSKQYCNIFGSNSIKFLGHYFEIAKKV